MGCRRRGGASKRASPKSNSLKGQAWRPDLEAKSGDTYLNHLYNSTLTIHLKVLITALGISSLFNLFLDYARGGCKKCCLRELSFVRNVLWKYGIILFEGTFLVISKLRVRCFANPDHLCKLTKIYLLHKQKVFLSSVHFIMQESTINFFFSKYLKLRVIHKYDVQLLFPMFLTYIFILNFLF